MYKSTSNAIDTIYKIIRRVYQFSIDFFRGVAYAMNAINVQPFFSNVFYHEIKINTI